ncbi:hypothetical protein UFOVP270_11 [uncultured Caudovirales phage]|uniref:Transmembrane protein n=1 Tax=uncultured Caudovirales phage TaxID=2100421 RepID=A0A6J5LLX6_9CAUD|nr:hypothetical protein UFOVP101_45 [uncultured Caudovirales phage]CAB4134057.1 hypothetical protein UFOVP270_11 [uncultured Caudovirales phage]
MIFAVTKQSNMALVGKSENTLHKTTNPKKAVRMIRTVLCVMCSFFIFATFGMVRCGDKNTIGDKMSPSHFLLAV